MTLLLVCQAHNGVVLGSSPSGPTKNYLKYRIRLKFDLSRYSYIYIKWLLIEQI
jgi:hypothetical protein